MSVLLGNKITITAKLPFSLSFLAGGQKELLAVKKVWSGGLAETELSKQPSPLRRLYSVHSGWFSIISEQTLL